MFDYRECFFGSQNHTWDLSFTYVITGKYRPVLDMIWLRGSYSLPSHYLNSYLAKIQMVHWIREKWQHSIKYVPKYMISIFVEILNTFKSNKFICFIKNGSIFDILILCLFWLRWNSNNDIFCLHNN